jgi:hypothetical protein
MKPHIARKQNQYFSSSIGYRPGSNIGGQQKLKIEQLVYAEKSVGCRPNLIFLSILINNI